MFTKEEKKENRIQFWTKLENELSKKKNPFGSKVNWMNYNTGIRHLYFRMEADESAVRLCIDLQFPDSSIREVYWEQFGEFKNMLDERFKNLIWLEEFEHWNGKTISRIVMEKEGVNILNRKDWDKMHLFLKLNFVKLDEWWCDFGEVFKLLK
ncbi:MAG: DUF4268 domain-containing protein [Flavobacteriales bacterium]|nr:DUF4268 domain-containing protein [Flavobacteriales bacterium]